MNTSKAISKNIILSRLLVSHDWMGKRFEEMMQSFADDSEEILLFRSVTAIIISDNIRPSFYTTRTGAIYIDSSYLYLTEAEKKNTPQFLDYRSDFAKNFTYEQYGEYYYKEDKVSSTKMMDGKKDFERAREIEEQEWDELFEILKGKKYTDYDKHDGSGIKTWWD
jgi:hypothetical protein